MEKLTQHSPDLTQRNIDKLAELFPAVVTEALDEGGNPIRAIDFDLLRQELSDHVVEGPQERYQLDWPGKREALFVANAPIAKTLRPLRDESVDFDTTKNLFIEGENLDGLKMLQESYLGKFKMIYIDPPYNTGNDFIYDDDYAESNAAYLARSGQTDNSGVRLVANTESNGRLHSDWLSMIYPRLKLARTLLAEDGVGFLSLDRNEVAQASLILAQIFGSHNLIATIVWASNLKGRQISDGGPAGTHEYILCFARNSQAISQFRGSGEEFRRLMPAIYKGEGYEVKRDECGPYVTKNELYNTNSKFNEKTARTMVFRIHVNPESLEVRVTDIEDDTTFPGFRIVMPHKNGRSDVSWHAWRWSRAKILADHRDLEFDFSGPNVRIRTKIRDVDGMTLKDLIVGPSTVTAQGDLDALGMSRLFDTPKPVALLDLLVAVATGPDDSILDFFAGSGSTAHAVMARNAKDGGNRRFVMIQLDEPCPGGSVPSQEGFKTIAAIGRERIRRAGAVLVRSAHPNWKRDVGFRTFRVDSTNMADVLRTPEAVGQRELEYFTASLKLDRDGQDLLFQVLIDWGLGLDMPIRSEFLEGQGIYVVEDDALIACFADGLGDGLISAIAKRKPLRAVFRDSGFATDADRINAEQTFAERSPATDVKTI